MQDELRQLKFMLDLVLKNRDMDKLYKIGLHNGLELAISKIEQRDPDFIDVNVLIKQESEFLAENKELDKQEAKNE